jgi:23S rRNA pseudouridine1911/1915/1917 synthase
MHTVPIQTEEAQETLFHWVTKRYPEVALVQGRKKIEGGFLHRLDRPTSGLVIVARNQTSFDHLLQQFQTNQVRKGYLAISRVKRPAAGWPSDLRQHDWDAILNGGDDMGNWAQLPIDLRMRTRFRNYGVDGALVKVVPGKTAKSFKSSRATEDFYSSSIKLLRRGIVPETNQEVLASYVTINNGFRHQIRSHLSYLGLPIIGDTDYADYNTMREFPPLPGLDPPKNDKVVPPEEANLPPGSLMLHASFLSFYHPKSGKATTVTGQVPPRMQQVGTLQLNNS